MASPPAAWIARAHCASLRLRATTPRAPAASHHLYIALLLDPRRTCRWGLYVGETSRDPDLRFDQHMTGYKASRHVSRYGVRLLPELVRHLTQLRRWEAVELEPTLAKELQKADVGWVEGGHCAGTSPATFPASLDQLPRHAIDGEGKPDRTRATTNYLEGAAVGYRWYDAKCCAPPFPFGHGLSYSRFAFSGLKVSPDGRSARFTVANIGVRAGFAVPQVYVSHAGREAPKGLAGFTKLELKPAQRREVTVALDQRLLAVFPEGRWTINGPLRLRARRVIGRPAGESRGDPRPAVVDGERQALTRTCGGQRTSRQTGESACLVDSRARPLGR